MATINQILQEYAKTNPKQAQIILDQSKELIVPAGAGTGKTQTLVNKIIQLLNNGPSLDSLLVLTFTKKAALEMKVRIKKSMRSRPNLSHLAANVDVAAIETFDAFAYNFVKQNAFLLGKSPEMQLLDATIFETIKYQMLDEVVSDLQNNASGEMIKYLYEMTGRNSDQDLLNELLKVYNSLSNSCGVEQFVKNPQYYELVKLDTSKIMSSLNKINPSFLLNEKNLTKVEDIIQKIANLYADVPYLTANYRFDWKGSEIDDTDKGKIKELLKPYTELLQKGVTLSDFLEHQNLINNYIDLTSHILLSFDQKLNQYKEALQKYEFSDIAGFLIRLLKENPSLLSAVKKRYLHVFIDEYQDTSDIQNEFINLITQDNDQVKVLYVGDIKQSIYKFRNAVPQNFIDKRKKVGVKNIILDANYRSAKPVIDFINTVFSKILVTEKEHDIVYYPDEVMVCGNTEYDSDENAGVYLLKHAASRHNLTEEAHAIAHQIKQLYDGKIIKDYSQCAILMRNKGAFDIYRHVFKYYQIPLQIQSDIDLKDIYFFKLMANVLKLAQIIEEDEMALKRFCYFSLLRSELYQEGDYQIFESLIDPATTKMVLNIKPEIKEKILKLNSLIKQGTNLEIIQNLMNLFDVKQKIRSSFDIETKELVIDYLYDLAKLCSDLNIVGSQFIEYIFEVAYNDTKIQTKVLENVSQNAVIMTNMHQSKGLEYDVLFLAGLEKGIAKILTRKVDYDKNLGLHFFTDLASVNIRLALVHKMYHMTNKEEVLKERLKEELRLLYVALTRAKRLLFMVTSNHRDESKECFAETLYQAADIEDLVNQSLILKDLVSVENIFELIREGHLYYDSAIDQIPEVKREFTEVENTHLTATIAPKDLLDSKVKEMMKKGTDLHTVFEQTNFKKETDNRYVKQFLNNSFDQLQPINALNIYKELSFNYEQVNGIMDLVIEYAEEIHIIDYKTYHIDSLKYIDQLNTYRQYLQTVYPQKEIKCFLYSIIQNKSQKV